MNSTAEDHSLLLYCYFCHLRQHSRTVPLKLRRVAPSSWCAGMLAARKSPSSKITTCANPAEPHWSRTARARHMQIINLSLKSWAWPLQWCRRFLCSSTHRPLIFCQEGLHVNTISDVKYETTNYVCWICASFSIRSWSNENKKSISQRLTHQAECTQFEIGLIFFGLAAQTRTECLATDRLATHDF